MLFLLDRQFNRYEMISDFISLIWTERWATNGDFEVKLRYSDRYRNILPGTVIELSEKESSPMVIETVTHNRGGSNGDEIVLSGRSVEIFADSIYFKDQQVFTGTMEGIAGELLRRATHFDRYQATFERFLDLSVFTSITGSSEDRTNYYYESNDDSILKQYQDLLASVNSGYVIRRVDNHELATWSISTTLSRNNDNIVFSTSMNDFESFSTIRSITSYRNLAMVRYSVVEGEYRYLTVVNPHLQGHAALDREVAKRMHLVDATNIKREDFADNTAFTQALRVEGLKALVDHRYIYTFDGKVSSENRFTFGKDYRIGDRIPVHHQGQTFRSRVTEYIWSATKDEIQGYPTLEFF